MTAQRKQHLAGTHRVRNPEHTWALVAPRLSRFGITRVADVTGLDVVGIPVALAVRPLSKTLSVSQGKGQSTVLAKVSAVMESIELWHAETAHPPRPHLHVPGAVLALPYRIQELPASPGSLVTERTPLDWIRAIGMLEATATFVPFALVCFLSPAVQRWKPPGLLLSSNGLASGNSRDEAALHGLYEIIERDAISCLPDSGQQIYLDPATVDDPACAEMIDRIARAGAELRIIHAPGRCGIPCFVSWLWDDAFPVPCLGAGAHHSPAVALSRAVTEAAQSRLTSIAASRDDQAPVYRLVKRGEGKPNASHTTAVAWRSLIAGFAEPSQDLAEDLRSTVRTVAEVTGREPLLIDLSTDDDLAVVKVIAPGMQIDMERVHPRTGSPGFMAGRTPDAAS